MNSFHQIHECDIKHLTYLLLKVILDGVRYFTNSLVSLPIIGHLIPLAYLNVNIFSSSIKMQYNLLYFFNCVTIRTLLSSFSYVGRIGWANLNLKSYKNAGRQFILIKCQNWWDILASSNVVRHQYLNDFTTEK